jgi:hypothetical protein
VLSNPQRLNEISIERHSDLGHGCLIYSFGNPGDFSFEEGMAQFFLDDTGDNNFLSHSCEIHMFDVDDYSKTLPDKYKDIIHIHRWGLKSSSTPTNDRALSIYSIDDVETNNLQDGSSKLARTKESQVYRTFQETIDKLGHKHRIIDVLKVDCERCEWDTYADWLAADVEIRQIQVEVHNVNTHAIKFFESLQKAGYVTFHKEANTIAKGDCYEYAFMKLKDSFFYNNPSLL